MPYFRLKIAGFIIHYHKYPPTHRLERQHPAYYTKVTKYCKTYIKIKYEGRIKNVEKISFN